MDFTSGSFKSSGVIKDAGVAKLNGKYVMVFRDDFDKAPWGGCYHIVVGIAFSDDGKHFEVRNKPFIHSAGYGISFLVRTGTPLL